MGSIYVSLQGGSPDQPLVVKPGETMPQLVSGGATSLTQDAQQSLRMLQSVVSDNAGPLRDTIANLKAFTNVLAANSGRVDHILEGLEHLAGGSDKPAAPPTFDLIVPPLDNLRLDLPEAQLVVNDPTSVVSLDTQRFLKTTSAGEVVLQTAQWTDVIPKLVQKKLVDAFSKAKYRFASPPTDNLTPDYTMMIDVRRFAVAEGPSMTANVEFGLRLMGKDNKVVDFHVATGTAPATDADGGAAAAAMTKAFEAAARDTMTWYAKAAATPQQ